LEQSSGKNLVTQGDDFWGPGTQFRRVPVNFNRCAFYSIVCLCVQHATVIFTLADVASVWNCSSCPEDRAVPCVSGVDTIPKDGTVSTASQASTETALGTRHTARCAEVSRPSLDTQRSLKSNDILKKCN